MVCPGSARGYTPMWCVGISGIEKCPSRVHERDVVVATLDVDRKYQGSKALAAAPSPNTHPMSFDGRPFYDE